MMVDVFCRTTIHHTVKYLIQLLVNCLVIRHQRRQMEVDTYSTAAYYKFITMFPTFQITQRLIHNFIRIISTYFIIIFSTNKMENTHRFPMMTNTIKRLLRLQTHHVIFIAKLQPLLANFQPILLVLVVELRLRGLALADPECRDLQFITSMKACQRVAVIP